MGTTEETKLETLEFQLKTLYDREAYLKKRFYDIKNDIYKKRTEVFQVKQNINIGDKVVNSINEKVYQFSKLDKSTSFDYKMKPWIYGRLIKKDGTSSKKETLLYSDWEKKV